MKEEITLNGKKYRLVKSLNKNEKDLKGTVGAVLVWIFSLALFFASIMMLEFLTAISFLLILLLTGFGFDMVEDLRSKITNKKA